MSDVPRIEGERTTSTVTTKTKMFSRKQKGALILLLGIVFVAWIIYENKPRAPVQTEYVAPTRVGAPQSLPYPPAPAPPAPVEPVLYRPPPLPPAIPQPMQIQATRPLPAQPPKLMVYGGGSQAPATAANAAHSGQAGGPGGDGGVLAAALKPTMLEGTTASMLPHPAFTIAQGTSIPCVMQTAMDSQLPGFATCEIPYDIKGNGGGPAAGGATLLDAGTQVFGEVRGGDQVRSGMDRLFVLWTRARTPHGVVINLASPATDALGRSGVEGEVNNHWLARFGDALLFTLIDSGTQIASSRLSGNGGTYLNLNSASTPATQTLQSNINIPPTITVRQGETVGIMVARDLDFSGIYGLSLRDGGRR